MRVLLRISILAVLALIAGLVSAATGPSQTSARLALGGDVMFGRWTDEGWRETPIPQDFDDTRRRLRAADLTLINLETAICDQEVAVEMAPFLGSQRNRFTAPPSYLSELTDGGVDVAIVANNHAMDCGPQSMKRTLGHLGEHDIAAAGVWRAGEPAFGRPNFVSFGMNRAIIIAVTAHPPPVEWRAAEGPATLWRWDHDTRGLVEYVANLRDEHPRDLVIVSLHWGHELAAHPTAPQRKLSRQLIDAGADVIYGHGAHVLQEVEHYGDKAIVYSAGNLFFERRCRSIIARRRQRDRGGEPSGR
ncbi:MAG: CapA family protein [Bradymonadaceae bacterium]